MYDSMAWIRQAMKAFRINPKIEEMNVPTVLFIIYTIYICNHMYTVYIYYTFSYTSLSPTVSLL